MYVTLVVHWAAHSVEQIEAILGRADRVVARPGFVSWQRSTRHVDTTSFSTHLAAALDALGPQALSWVADLQRGSLSDAYLAVYIPVEGGDVELEIDVPSMRRLTQLNLRLVADMFCFDGPDEQGDGH